MKAKENDLVKPRRHRLLIFVYASFCTLFPLGILFPRSWPPAVFPWIVGLLAVLMQTRVLLRLDFLKIRLIRKVGRALEYVFFVPALFFLAIAIAASIGVFVLQVPSEVGPYLGFILAGTFIIFVVGVLLDSYTDAFFPRTLAGLYFRQAREMENPSAKLDMIREAFKNLKEVAADFYLEFDSSGLEHLFALRLFDRQDVNKDLDRVSTRLLHEDSIPSVMNELGGDAQDLFSPRKTRRRGSGAKVESVAKRLGWLPPFLVAMLSATPYLYELACKLVKC